MPIYKRGYKVESTHVNIVSAVRKGAQDENGNGMDHGWSDVIDWSEWVEYMHSETRARRPIAA